MFEVWDLHLCCLNKKVLYMLSQVQGGSDGEREGGREDGREKDASEMDLWHLRNQRCVY